MGKKFEVVYRFFVNVLSLLRKVLQSLGDQILFRRCFMIFYSIVQLTALVNQSVKYLQIELLPKGFSLIPNCVQCG